MSFPRTIGADAVHAPLRPTAKLAQASDTGSKGLPPSQTSGVSNPIGVPVTVPVGSPQGAYLPNGGGGITGSPSLVGANEPQIQFEAIIPLLLAFIAWGFSLHLWKKSAQFHTWVTNADKNSPASDSGLGALILTTLAVALFSFFYWTSNYYSGDDAGSFWYLVLSILRYPYSFFPLVLVFGLIPAGLAFFNYLIAIPLAQTASVTAEANAPLTRSPKAAIVGAVIGLINLAASVVTLWIWLHPTVIFAGK
jgi:hypothetical protein